MKWIASRPFYNSSFSYMVSDCSFERFCFSLWLIWINMYSFCHSICSLVHNWLFIISFGECSLNKFWWSFKFNVNWEAVQAEFCLTLIVRIIFIWNFFRFSFVLNMDLTRFFSHLFNSLSNMYTLGSVCVYFCV